jgi:hypothetical protein
MALEPKDGAAAGEQAETFEIPLSALNGMDVKEGSEITVTIVSVDQDTGVANAVLKESGEGESGSDYAGSDEMAGEMKPQPNS